MHVKCSVWWKTSVKEACYKNGHRFVMGLRLQQSDYRWIKGYGKVVVNTLLSLLWQQILWLKSPMWMYKSNYYCQWWVSVCLSAVCKEPPYKVEESGYAGFIMPIEVYFKNKVGTPQHYFVVYVFYGVEKENVG